MAAEEHGAFAVAVVSAGNKVWCTRNFNVFLLLQVGQDAISTCFCVPLSINRKSNYLVAAKK